MSQEKNLLLLILLIYFRAHIYSLELHHSNECFYLMKTSFTRITISRCPWYMRTKRQSPSNIFLTILIYFLANSAFTQVLANIYMYYWEEDLIKYQKEHKGIYGRFVCYLFNKIIYILIKINFV